MFRAWRIRVWGLRLDEVMRRNDKNAPLEGRAWLPVPTGPPPSPLPAP